MFNYKVISVRKDWLHKIAFAADFGHRPVHIDLRNLLCQSLKTRDLLIQAFTQFAEQRKLQVDHLLFCFQD
ncbi:hypothetical protein D3C81_2017580 [compost metagenome]